MEQHNPLVSIIMPTCNRADYILETIDSIRKQTYTNWELLIMDDGSDDNTEELISAIKDKRIQFQKLGRIGINGKVKNAGLKIAKGELIAFMDSDDLWHPEKTERQVKALLDYPGAVFSTTGGYNFREEGVPVEYFYKEKEGNKYGNVFIPFCKGEISAFIQTLIIWKDRISHPVMFNELKPFADREYFGMLAYNHSAIVLYEPLLYRRLHSSSHSHMIWVDNFHNGIEEVKYFKNKKMLPGNIEKEVLFKSYINFGEKATRYKKWGLAFIAFLNAWKNKPISIIPAKKMAKTIWSSIRYVTILFKR